MKSSLITLFAVIVLLIPCLGLASYSPESKYSVPPEDAMTPNGEYVVFVQRDGKWVEVGRLPCDKYFRDRTLDVGQFLNEGDEVKIRIQQRGGGAAHIDSVSLGLKPPVSMSEKGLLRKVAKKDFDVFDAYGKTFDFVFSSSGTEKTLRLDARIEGKRIAEAPFQFRNMRRAGGGSSGSSFYTYRIGSGNNRKSVNSLLFKEFCPTGSGHPYGYTYCWVWDDGRDLRVEMDFTPDNTMDGDKDYAKIFVLEDEEVKEFKVSVNQTTWGYPQFAYTETVPYQHKVYHFSIPLAEIGTKQGGIRLAFSAYGTAAAPSDFGDAPSPYPTQGAGAAYHAIPMAVDLLRLGTDIDLDPDGQPDPQALGDDNDADGDDEDGVTFASALTAGDPAEVSVQVSGIPVGAAAFLNAWIDFNQDGDWADAGEQIFSDEPVSSMNNLWFNVPADAALGNTFARFRLTSYGGGVVGYDDFERDGEVEDYMVSIVGRPVRSVPTMNQWGILLLALLLGPAALLVARRKST